MLVVGWVFPHGVPSVDAPTLIIWSSRPAFRRTALWLLLPACLYPQQASSVHTLLTWTLHVGSRSLLSCGRVWEAQRCPCAKAGAEAEAGGGCFSAHTAHNPALPIDSPERRTPAPSGASWDHRARQPKAVPSTVLRRLSSGASLPPRPSPLLATRLSTRRLSSRHPWRLRLMSSPGHQLPP